MVKPRAPRRTARKPSMKKAKAMVTKNHKQKAKRNMDTYFLRCRTVANVTPVQGVAVHNYVYQVFNMDPINGQIYETSYLKNAEFKLWSLQYDKFRVNSVTVVVTPKANVLDLANAQNDTAYKLTGDGCVHTVIDRDGKAPSSIAQLARYPSYRKYSVTKKFSRTYAIKYPTGIWLDCDAPALFSMSKELGLTGSITMYAEDLLEDSGEVYNEPWAQIEVFYNIVFQGKTSNSLSAVYTEGEITGVCINKNDATLNLPETPFRNVRGTINVDTRTDNDVYEIPISDQNVDLS